MEWTRTKLCLTPISTLLDPAALSLVSQQAPQFLPWRQSTWSFKYSSNDFSGSSLFQLFPSSAIYLLMAFISAPSDTLCIHVKLGQIMTFYPSMMNCPLYLFVAAPYYYINASFTSLKTSTFLLFTRKIILSNLSLVLCRFSVSNKNLTSLKWINKRVSFPFSPCSLTVSQLIWYERGGGEVEPVIDIEFPSVTLFGNKCENTAYCITAHFVETCNEKSIKAFWKTKGARCFLYQLDVFKNKCLCVYWIDCENVYEMP